MSRAKALSIALNQDQDCFICGLENGFRVINCQPLEERERFDFPDGGIGNAEMLFRCNFLALVGGGKSPKFPSNKVIIWDDRKKRSVITLPFKSEVKGVRLRRDRIVVVLDTKTIVFTFTEEPEQLHVFQTCDNPSGLCALCPDADNRILILPGIKKGQVQIIDLGDTSKAGQIIDAHVTGLACISLNRQGTMLATASEKGTLLRVFDTRTSKQLYELRRGSTSVTITSINFSSDSSKIVVSSDKTTVHIFNLAGGASADGRKPANSGMMPTYFSSTWSFAKFSVGCPKPVCSFAEDGKAVYAICTDGSFYRCTFTTKGETETTISNFLALPPAVT